MGAEMIRGLVLLGMLFATPVLAQEVEKPKRSPVVFARYLCGSVSEFNCMKAVCEEIGYKKFMRNRPYNGDVQGNPAPGGLLWLENLVCHD
jgi:hypothetical protein